MDLLYFPLMTKHRLSEVELDDQIHRAIERRGHRNVLAKEPDLTETTMPIHNAAMEECRALFRKTSDPDVRDIAYQRHFERLASERNGKMLSAL